MHSVKNRFLMRVKNATPAVFRRCWAPMIARDSRSRRIAAVGALLAEGVLAVAKCLPRAVRQRREIMRRRRVADDDLAHWFAFRPAYAPASRPRPHGPQPRARASSDCRDERRRRTR